MDLRLFATVFSTILVAELGDETQIATLLYAADGSQPRMTLFLASASALAIASALAVGAGVLIDQWVNPRVMRVVAGVGFIAVGVWVLFSSEG